MSSRPPEPRVRDEDLPENERAIVQPDGRAPPPGFHRNTPRGPFSTHNGPFYDHDGPDGFRRGFYVLRRHCNGFGYAHGGLLTTFVDALLAMGVYKGSGRRGPTVHLSVDFLSIAKEGEWVEGTAQLTRATRDLAFVEARVFVGDRDVVRSQAIFKLQPEKA